VSIATQTETATGLRRAGGGNYADGEAGEQGTPAAIAVDTIQDGLLDVQVHQPAEGQEAATMTLYDLRHADEHGKPDAPRLDHWQSMRL
jgi:hypothetical protein